MKRVRFPKRIKRGSCVVTIYRSRNKGYASFTVVHYDAVDTASKLSEGKPDMLVLAGQELLVYRRAMQALEPIGASLDTAAVRFAELMQRNNGDVCNNVPAPKQAVCEPVTSKLVGEVLKDLLAAKAEKRVSRTRRSVRYR